MPLQITVAILNASLALIQSLQLGLKNHKQETVEEVPTTIRTRRTEEKTNVENTDEESEKNPFSEDTDETEPYDEY